MKRYLYVLLFLALTAMPVSAQMPLVLFDDFQAKVLDPNKWAGKGVGDPGVNALEHGRMLKNDPVLGIKGLDLFNRSYAAQGGDSGRSTGYNRMYGLNGGTVTTIQSTVVVKKIDMIACSSNTEVVESMARIGGMFFNTGTTTQGDQTNDIFAFLIISRTSDSSDPPGVLRIYGMEGQCGNATCDSGNTTLGTVDIGTINVNKPVKVRISWDQANNQFVFQKGKSPEVYLPNAATVGGEPGTPLGGGKRVEIYHRIPNCTTLPRAMGFIETIFDNIMVNQ